MSSPAFLKWGEMIFEEVIHSLQSPNHSEPIFLFLKAWVFTSIHQENFHDWNL